VRSWRHLPKSIQRHVQIAAACCAVLLLALAVNLNDWIGGSKRAIPD